MNPNVLLLTLVIALEPLPVLGGVLLLTAERGRPKAIGFLSVGRSRSRSLVSSSCWSAVRCRRRPGARRRRCRRGWTSSWAWCSPRSRCGRAKAAQGTERTTPGWMKRLDTMSPVPPSSRCVPAAYLLAVAVGNEIVRRDLDSTARIVAVILYVVIGSIGILIPILVTIVQPAAPTRSSRIGGLAPAALARGAGVAAARDRRVPGRQRRRRARPLGRRAGRGGHDPR